MSRIQRLRRASVLVASVTLCVGGVAVAGCEQTSKSGRAGSTTSGGSAAGGSGAEATGRGGSAAGGNGATGGGGATTGGSGAADPCSDVQQNGSESDVDCGGLDCPKCDDGETCAAPADCQSGFCADGVCCAEACDGGCGVCALALGATEDGTCTPRAKDAECRASTGACDRAEGCDGSSADCPADTLAADGEPSLANGCDPYLCDGLAASCPTGCADQPDCIQGYWCVATACQQPKCDDQVKDGSETDIDCGGQTCPKCAVGKTCLVGSDCTSGSCNGGVCLPFPGEVTAGYYHTCARKQDGTLWCWGNNYHGQLGDGTTASPKPSPVQVTALGTSAVEVAPGYFYTCARKQDGTLWCWGCNSGGKLGDGTTTGTPSPVQVTALGTSAVEVAASFSHTCARKQDGTLWCWGDNYYGQLGDGTTVWPKTSPVQVAALGASAVEVAAGEAHTCARKGDGTLWCWGNNYYGQLGDGTTTDKLSPVQVPLACP
jgi:hypothetical protein